MARLLKSMEDTAKANTDLVKSVQDGTINANRPADTGVAAGAVTLTNVSVKMDMGESAEERLVNFIQWTEEVEEKLTLAGVTDTTLMTRVALMWGGMELKEYTIQRAGVRIKAEQGPDQEALAQHTWEEAHRLIKDKMELGLNEAFATSKFRQCAQGQRTIDNWLKKLGAQAKTLRLGKCTCGHGYSDERAIRDVMVELTTDTKLRKDALSKDLTLDDLIREGKANELARSRNMVLEGGDKKIKKLQIDTETQKGRKVLLTIQGHSNRINMSEMY